MKKFLVVLSLAMLLPSTVLWAQVLAPNKAGVALSHWHTIVRDVDATKKFWILMGGKSINVDGTEVMKFPGVLVFMTPGSSPTGGSSGTVIDHTGFNLRDDEAFLAKMKAAGQNVVPPYVTSPDGLKIEIQPASHMGKRPLLGYSKEPDTLMVSDHIHYLVPEPQLPEVQAWYVKMVGGNGLREPNSGLNYAVDWPGLRMRLGGTRLWKSLSPSGKPLPPTKGRALDHVGFEVKNLEAYCKKLEAMGVKFDKPYSKSRHASFASAELTDPWGASLELTEGLNKF